MGHEQGSKSGGVPTKEAEAAKVAEAAKAAEAATLKVERVWTIRTPANPGFGGVRSGVSFRDGLGSTTDKSVAAELAAQGYQVEPPLFLGQ